MNSGSKTLFVAILILLFTFSGMSIAVGNRKIKAVTPDHQKPVDEGWIIDTIPDGGSIYSVLDQHNLDPLHVALIAYRFGEFIDVTTIQPGDTLKILPTQDPKRLQKMIYIQQLTQRHHFTVVGDSLIYRLENLPTTERNRVLEGELKGTLDATLLALGLHHGAKQQINNGLEYEINFNRDARNGDKFRVLISEKIFEGQPIPGTKVLYVSYDGERTGFRELYRFEDKDPKSVLNGLYNLEGESANIGGTGFPLTSIHVVSNFGNRSDPFTGRGAFHQGYDYRASYGTPVFAVAHGTVTEARHNGGWGNNILIRHASGMQSHYAHLSSLSVSCGQKVVRGQIIGRVGSTGRSTGAHLHFGLKSGNSWVSPTLLNMVGAERLDAAQMKDFADQQVRIRQQMNQGV